MKKEKLLTLIFYIGFIISIAISGTLLFKINQMVAEASNANEIMSSYNLMQKKIGIVNITAFIILLFIALIDYYKQQNARLIFIINIAFVAASLFLYHSVNRSFYALSNPEFNTDSGYWLTLFMGVFYIVGAILISAIGYITVRNNIKRHLGTRK